MEIQEKSLPTIGVVLGGFCPLHTGHMDIIHRAQKECDYTFVVVCGYNDEPRALELGLNIYKRYEIIHKFLTNTVTDVIYINDSDLGLDDSCSIENWRMWSEAAINKMKESCLTNKMMPALSPDDITHDNLVFYVSETAYHASLGVLGFQRVLCDRYRNNPASGTSCREDYRKNWNNITLPFRKHLVKRMLFTGTASAGKSTMCKDMANYFGLPFCTEYGRDYMELSHKTDHDLTYDIFIRFLNKQHTYTCESSKTAAYGRGVMLSDTDALITLMYAHEYAMRDDFPNINMDEYKKLEAYAAENILKSGRTFWEKIFLFKPNQEQEFVDDGTRFMGQSSYDERMKNYNFLLSLMMKYYDMSKVVIIDTPDRYLAYKTIKSYIEDYVC